MSSPRFTKTNMCIETRAQAEKKELRIDDKIYDVTNFAKKHPGGKVVLFQVGTDASDAFHAFHDKSKSAKKWLKTLESRDAKPSDIPNLADSDPLTRDFRVLREQLRTEGFFDPSVRQITWRMTELFLMHIIGVYLVLQGYRWPGIAVLGVASGRCGWFMHEGGHYSLTGNIKFDRHIQMFFYGVGCGMSGCYWRNQHNKHHATPQKIKHDVDLETLPLVAFHKVVAQKAKGSLQKLWISWQAYLFAPVITLLVTLGWQLFTHPRHSYRVKNYTELWWMAVRYVLWFGGFSTLAGWSFGEVLVNYLVYCQLGGAYIFTNFAVSHTHLPVVNADEHRSWVQYSAQHTMNCNAGPICNWWMAYLNFQIEHHLFPSMPQYNHPKTSMRVQALFAKHGVKYDSRPFFTAIRDTFVNLNTAGNHHDHHD